MTTDSYLWATNLDTSEHPQGYNEREAQAMFTAARGIPTNLCGVCTGFGVSITSARRLSVEAGSAYVNGIFAWDDSATTLVLNPVSLETAFIVVVEANWTTQTCQIRAIQATDGGLALPNLVQNVFDIWQIPLACGTMDNAGAFYQYFGLDWTDIRNSGNPVRFPDVLNDLRTYIGNQSVETIIPDTRIAVVSGNEIVLDNFPQNYPVLRMSLNLEADSSAITDLSVEFQDAFPADAYMGTLKPLFADNVTASRASTDPVALPISITAGDLYHMEVYVYAWRSTQRPCAIIFTYGEGGEGMSVAYFDSASNFSNKFALIFNNDVVLNEATLYGIDNQRTFGY